MGAKFGIDVGGVYPPLALYHRYAKASTLQPLRSINEIRPLFGPQRNPFDVAILSRVKVSRMTGDQATARFSQLTFSELFTKLIICIFLATH